MLSSERELTSEERRVILREFRTLARIEYGARGFLGLVVAPAFAMMAVAAFGREWWSQRWLIGTASLVMALLCLFPLLRLLAKLATLATPRELRAVTVHGRCQTLVPPGKYLRAIPCVGPYGVTLRPGWEAFFPEGKDATVELCFPPRRYVTGWADAAVVSLPGIDIRAAEKHPAPNEQAGVTAAVIALACLFGIIWFFPRGARFDEIATRAGRSGKATRFTSVAELLAARPALGVEVTLASATRIEEPEVGVFLCDLGESLHGTLRRWLHAVEQRQATQLDDEGLRSAENIRHLILQGQLHAEESDCLRVFDSAGDAPDAATSFRVTVDHDVRGMLAGGREFRVGASQAWLLPLVGLGALSVVMLGAGWLAVRAKLRPQSFVEDWVRAVRAEMAKRAP